MQFKVGDKAVYLAHGVGEIKSIESKEIGGQRQDFYILKILSSGVTFMIPTTASEKSGMRGLMSKHEVDEVYRILKTPRKVVSTTWNRRFREFKEKLYTGSIIDTAWVLRDLASLKTEKPLSFSERELHDKALERIVKEISLASNRFDADVESDLVQRLTPN